MALPTQASDPSAKLKKWNPPSLALKWGPYFSPDPEDEAKTVDTAVKAKTAGIITTRMAVEKVARIFGVENVDAVMGDIESEKAEADAKDLEKTEATAAIGAKFAPAPKPPKPKAPPKK